MLGVGVPVGEDDEPGAVLDGGVDLGADLVEPGGERLAAAADAVEAGEGRGLMPGMSPSALMCMSLASSSLSITGKGRVTLRQDAAVGSRRLPSGRWRSAAR